MRGSFPDLRMPAEPLSSLPAPVSSLVERKDLALRGALEHLAPGPWVERAGHARGVRHRGRRLAPVEAPLRAVPRRAGPAAARGARPARAAPALLAPGRGLSARHRRRAHRRHHAHRLGQDALLQPAGPRRHPQGHRDARALPVPDQGAGAGPDGGAARAVRADRRGRWRGDRRAHLRRRHAGRRPQDDPRPRPHRADQPRHAARRRAPAPSALGQAVREPALRGDRRAPRLPRRVRQPPVQRAAPPAAHLPALRLGPAVHLLVGDHRQPAPAGRAAGRAALLAHRRERRAARREVRGLRQPAGGQPRAGHPPLLPGRGPPRGRRVPAPAPAGHRLRAEPAGDRNPHHLSQGRLRDGAGHGRADPRLPRRLPAAAPARNRKGAARGPGARRRRHQRAGARHRHRCARCRGAGRLSRARSPRPGSGPGAPAGAARARRR